MNGIEVTRPTALKISWSYIGRSFVPLTLLVALTDIAMFLALPFPQPGHPFTPVSPRSIALI